MSAQHHSPSTTPSADPIPTAFVLSALVIGAVAMAGRSGGHEAPDGHGGSSGHGAQTQRWTRPGEQAEALKASFARRAAQTSKALLDSPEARALLAHAELINDHAFVTAPIPARKKESLYQTLGPLVSDAWTRAQGPRFVELGEPLFARCTRGLEQVRADVRAGKLTVELARTDPPIAQYADYRQGCGKLIPELIALKLMDGQLQWRRDDAPLIMELLQRYRWAGLAARMQQPAALISPIEWQALSRWRILDPEAFPIKRRIYLASLVNAEVLGQEPQLVMARLELEQGRREQAVTLLKRLLASQPQHKEALKLLGELDPREVPTMSPVAP